MSEQIQNDKQWICAACPLNQGETCGPFPENNKLFLQIKQFHTGHDGWQLYKEGSEQLDVGFQSGIDYVLGLVENVEYEEKERERAKGPPLQQIENYCNSIVKKEERLVKKILRVCFSAYTNNPLNLAIMAPTSEGKTYAVSQITELFPKHDVIFIGKMSPTALIHQEGTWIDVDGNPIEERYAELESQLGKETEDKSGIRQALLKLRKDSKNLVNLDNKILVFAEPPNSQLWDMLKPILSHDQRRITYKTTQTDGSLKVRETLVMGWPAVIFCSAKNEKREPIWDEIETRFDIESPNTSIEKYHEANKHTALKIGTPSFAEDMVNDSEDEKYTRHYIHKIKDVMLELRKDNDKAVFNPFAEIIGEHFMHNEGIAMRSCGRFMQYCTIETYINSEGRCKLQFKRKKSNEIVRSIITSISDVNSAINMMGNVSVIPPDKLNFLKDVFDPCVGSTMDNTTTTTLLAKKYTEVTGKETDAKKILENYVYPLCDYGVLDFKINEDDKRQKLYKYSRKPSVNSLDFIRERIIEESKNNRLLIKSVIDKIREYSKKSGEVDSILDSDGKVIKEDELQYRIIPQQSNNSGVNQAQKQEQSALSESSKVSS